MERLRNPIQRFVACRCYHWYRDCLTKRSNQANRSYSGESSLDKGSGKRKVVPRSRYRTAFSHPIVTPVVAVPFCARLRFARNEHTTQLMEWTQLRLAEYGGTTYTVLFLFSLVVVIAPILLMTVPSMIDQGKRKNGFLFRIKVGYESSVDSMANTLEETCEKQLESEAMAHWSNRTAGLEHLIDRGKQDHDFTEPKMVVYCPTI
jgi:hypothetical protein